MRHDVLRLERAQQLLLTWRGGPAATTPRADDELRSRSGGGGGAGGGVGGWAEVVHTNFRAADPGGTSALSQVALRCTRTVRKLRQLESLYSATEALTPHDDACTKYCWPSMVGPAVQLFHVVASGIGAPEKLGERNLHDVSSYAVMVTETPV